MKKIAFTTSGQNLDSAMDPRFGRAAHFLIYDLKQGTFELVDNQQGRNAAQGAGIQAAETIVRAGVAALVTGHCGPKAFKVLDSAGVAVYNCNETTVDGALTAFRADTLTRASASDVDGHW